MPYYSYHAIDNAGVDRSGTVMAENKSAAIAKLKTMHLYPTRVFLIDKEDPAAKTSQKKSPILRARPSWLRGRVRTKDIIAFIRDFSILVEAGMPIARTLSILSLQTLSSNMKTIINGFKTEVESGQSLSESLKKYPNLFPELYINMIRAGELGGGQLLSEVLKRLADLGEATERLNARIRAALTYPAVVLTFAFLVVIALVTFVLPKFFIIYDDLNLALPMVTRILFKITLFLRNHWYLFIVFFAAGSVLVSVIRKNKQAHFLWDMYKLKLPVLGSIFTMIALSRFARTFGTLLNSGVPILHALTIVKDATGNSSMAAAIDNVKNSIREGESIASPLSHYPVFPPLMTNMIAIGEETGTVGTMLIKIANKYDEDVETILLQLTSLLEPFLILILGVIVAFVIIALFMPLITLMRNLSA